MEIDTLPSREDSDQKLNFMLGQEPLNRLQSMPFFLRSNHTPCVRVMVAAAYLICYCKIYEGCNIAHLTKLRMQRAAFGASRLQLICFSDYRFLADEVFFHCCLLADSHGSIYWVLATHTSLSSYSELRLCETFINNIFSRSLQRDLSFAVLQQNRSLSITLVRFCGDFMDMYVSGLKGQWKLFSKQSM